MRAGSPRKSDKISGERIQVCVRMRPLLKPAEDEVAWDIDPENNAIFPINTMKLLNTKTDVMKLKTRDLVARRYSEANSGQQFSYDYLEGPESKTQDIYTNFCKKIVSSVLDGYHGTIFMYGQTTSGKTYTMLGSPKDPGILPCALKNLFTEITRKEKVTMRVAISYMEIYNEVINDLLEPGSTNLKISEDSKYGISVKGLRKEYVGTFEEAIILMNYGEEQRMYRETNYNEHSSRSHTIYQVHIESYKEDEEIDETSLYSYSCLNLVDLAGSERLNEFDSTTGAHTEETGHINKSLFLLTNVIKKLSDGHHQHIPYRDSKLTRILSNALGGNSLTAIICAVSPALMNYQQTLSTLRFAIRAKQVKTTPVVNRIIEDHLHLQLKQEIRDLKNRLTESEGEIDNVTRINEELTDTLYQTKHEIISLHKELGELKNSTYKDSKANLQEQDAEQILNGSLLDNLSDSPSQARKQGGGYKKKGQWEMCFGDQIINHVDFVLGGSQSKFEEAGLRAPSKEWNNHFQKARAAYLRDLQAVQKSYTESLKDIALHYTNNNHDINTFISEYADSEHSRIEDQLVRNHRSDPFMDSQHTQQDFDTLNLPNKSLTNTQQTQPIDDSFVKKKLEEVQRERDQTEDPQLKALYSEIMYKIEAKYDEIYNLIDRKIPNNPSNDFNQNNVSMSKEDSNISNRRYAEGMQYEKVKDPSDRSARDVGYSSKHHSAITFQASEADGLNGSDEEGEERMVSREAEIIRKQIVTSKKKIGGLREGMISYIWGSGKDGRLGLGSSTSEKYPVELEGLYFSSIVCGYHNTFGLSSEGLVYSWGKNEMGQLGDGGNTDIVEPINITALNRFTITAISCGWQHVAALTSTGKLLTWGCGDDGQLGHGNNETLNKPSEVLFFKNMRVVKMTCGHSQTAAITCKNLI